MLIYAITCPINRAVARKHNAGRPQILSRPTIPKRRL